MPESMKSQPDEFSKTHRKKEMTDLQKIGEALVNLAESQLANVPLPEKLLEAVNVARSLKSQESKRRQLQYIGKLMRGIDPELIKIALQKIQVNKAQNAAQFHRVEKWRDQLIAEGDAALQQWMESYPASDRQHMRQLIRKAQHDRANQKNTGGETALFRYIRDTIAEATK